MRDDLAHALEVGRKVTAKVQWLSKTAPKTRARWIHCTPLLGVNDAIGVWMVILVDDEDDLEGNSEQKVVDLHNTSRLGSSYTAEAVPWDAVGHKTATTGVSNNIWSEGSDSMKSAEERNYPKLKKPLVRHPPDTGGPAQSPIVIRPGPKIAGKAYSYTSISHGHIAADDGASIGSDRSRPSSSSSSILTPAQISMQPKVRIAGRQSMDSDNARKPPINVPYRPSVDGKEENRVIPVRRTYKSLSPYGILFED